MMAEAVLTCPSRFTSLLLNLCRYKIPSKNVLGLLAYSQGEITDYEPRKVMSNGDITHSYAHTSSNYLPVYNTAR
jgi:hypothetical protein